MENIKNIIKETYTKYISEELPRCLSSKVTTFYVIGSIIIVVSLIISILSILNGQNPLQFVFPFFVGLCLVLAGFLTKLNIILQGIKTVEGTCIKIESPMMLKKHLGYDITLSVDDELVEIKVVNKRFVPIPGQKMRIYLPKKQSFYKDAAGIIHHQSVYGIEFI